MTWIRGLGLVLCVSAVGVLLGCNDRPHSEPSGLPPTPTSSKSPGPGSVESPIVTVMPNAAATIKDLVADNPRASKVYLRVRVVPGGCQGFLHKLDLDLVVSPEDHVCESAGVSIVMFKRQAEMLRGTRVDFVEENGQKGFKVDNPNFMGETAKRWLAVLEKEKDNK